METGTLRTVPFKEIYGSILSRLGLDPSQPVPHNLWQAIPRNINKRLRTAWTYWEWPYLEQCDERAFARTWLSDHQFAAGEAVIYVADLKYYRALDADPPIGTVPTNETYWEPLTDYGNLIAFDQICRRPMGMVLGVYGGDPRSNGCGCSGLNYRPQGNGIAVCGTSGPTVFVKYQLPVPRFSLTPYAPGREYVTGNLVYDSITGECYIATVSSQDEAPPDPSFWLRQNFPAVFEDYVVAAAYASCLKETSQAAEAGDQQQMRMMWARDAEAEAEDKLVEEIDKLKAMGQRFHYRSWKETAHTMCRPPGVCASEPFSEPGFEPPVTTLEEICESDPTAYPPAPDVPEEPGIEVVSGITALVIGQNYVDVEFLTEQRNSRWIFIECRVVNTADPTPLNIWPGIVTTKTKEGFRLQLNGTPDTAHYFLHWTIKEPPIGSVEAESYLFSGPLSGAIGAPATFTVMLPPGTLVTAPVTITPSDGGGGGTFAPTSVTLTNDEPVANFTYTPASYGSKTIAVTNSGALEDPSHRNFTAVVATYLLSGPSTGDEGEASTAFTVQLPTGGAIIGSAVVTPGDGGAGGTFAPTTVALTTAAPSATFTYTPLTIGGKTISVTNNRGLTNPGNLTYTATTPAPIVLDTFTDTNGTPLPSHTMDTGTGWTRFEGDSTNQMVIFSNAVASFFDAAHAYAYFTESGVADCVITVIGAFGGADALHYNQIVFRYSDALNWWTLRVNGSGSGNVELVKSVAGTETVVSTGSLSVIANNQYELTVTLSGTSISVDAAGTALGTTDSFNQTATKHGIRSYQGVTATPNFMNDFAVTA